MRSHTACLLVFSTGICLVGAVGCGGGTVVEDRDVVVRSDPSASGAAAGANGDSAKREPSEQQNESVAASRSFGANVALDSGRRRHALLVGCTDYANLDEWFQLRGPVNDVALVRQLLIDRFGFDPGVDDVVTLAVSEGPQHQPTRANIEREFRRLGQSVQAGEPVVILLGGHGSQQPDNDPWNPEDPEPDGRDEIFLPSDVGKWNGDTGTVENAIVDDDFRSWLSAMVDRGAFIWLIMDACHSGSGVRGSDAEISRHVPPEILVPEDAFAGGVDQIILSADTVEVGGRAAADDLGNHAEGGLVAIYAAQPHETTPERKLPLNADSDHRKYYGLLTYTIFEILSGTSRNLTYNELVQAIQNRYITMGRRAPTPLIEGNLRDNLILGHESFPERSRIILRRVGSDQWKINVGALVGMATGSILAVYPPVGTENAGENGPLGHVRIVSQDLNEASVEPCELGEIAATDDLPDRGRCEVAYEDFGALKLRVAVDTQDASGDAIPPDVREKIIKDLRSESSNLVQVIEDSEDATWLARFDGGKVQLVPWGGITRGDVQGHQKELPPVRVAPGWSETTIANLEHVARAENLLRLTAIGSGAARSEHLDFAMTVVDSSNRSPIQWQSGGLTLKDGAAVTVQLANNGKLSLDVTLLYVDSAYGITCLYPELGEINRLEGGEQTVIDLKINAETTGIENLVAIVVRGQGQTVDFSILEQPSLDVGRSMGFGEDALSTPLGELCRSAMYGIGITRGIARSQTKDYGVTVLTWRIEP